MDSAHPGRKDRRNRIDRKGSYPGDERGKVTPSVVVDVRNMEEYKSGRAWVEPVEGKPEFDNGKPTGET